MENLFLVFCQINKGSSELKKKNIDFNFYCIFGKSSRCSGKRGLYES